MSPRSETRPILEVRRRRSSGSFAAYPLNSPPSHLVASGKRTVAAMSKHLENDLKRLESSISQQATLVEQMVRTAYRGLQERCLGTAAEILSQEGEVNQREVRIEEECLKTLALHQPVAIDLRRTAAVLKINSDLERIADLALNLAERTESLVGHPEIPLPQALETMVERVIEMLHDAHQAFITLDEKLAEKVRLCDDEVDELNREVIAQLVRVMEENPDRVEGSLHLFSASRIVERIGDHATNIAEDVMYMVKGEITRHKLKVSKSA